MLQSIILMFSDQKATQVFRFPWYDKLRLLVEPIVKQVNIAQTSAHDLKILGWST